MKAHPQEAFCEYEFHWLRIDKYGSALKYETAITEMILEGKKLITRDEAFALLKKYNKDPFHIQHTLTVEAVMKW